MSPTNTELAAKRLRDLIEHGRAMLKSEGKVSEALWDKIDEATDDLVESFPEDPPPRRIP